MRVNCECASDGNGRTLGTSAIVRLQFRSAWLARSVWGMYHGCACPLYPARPAACSRSFHYYRSFYASFYPLRALVAGPSATAVVQRQRRRALRLLRPPRLRLPKAPTPATHHTSVMRSRTTLVLALVVALVDQIDGVCVSSKCYNGGSCDPFKPDACICPKGTHIFF